LTALNKNDNVFSNHQRVWGQTRKVVQTKNSIRQEKLLMDRLIKVLLLLALPASGKSEVRKVLASLTPQRCRDEFYMGPTVQLDDYPYVEFMRFVDEVADHLLHLGNIFFQAHDRPFKDPFEWLTLIELLNEDFANLHETVLTVSTTPALDLFDRIDRAERRAGATIKLGRLPWDIRQLLAIHLNEKAKKIQDKLVTEHPDLLEGKTVVIEFSRGHGPNALKPLDPPQGYEASLRHLSPQILRQANILYVQVDPAESRRKNAKRAVPPPGCTDTTIYHGVPTNVMLNDYAGDDMEDLMNMSGQPGTVWIGAHGEKFRIFTAHLDNRQDLTSFAQAGPPESWDKKDVNALTAAISRAMEHMAPC